MKSSKFITNTALIAGLYSAITIFLAPISFGPLQVRIAEALTVLPFLFVEAVPGLWIGCLIANIYGGLGPIDIFGGSFLTLLAAFLTHQTRKFNKPSLAPLPPVLINAFGVSAYLQFLVEPPAIPIFQEFKVPAYFLFVITIGIGELISCYGLGLPLLKFLLKRKAIRKIS